MRQFLCPFGDDKVLLIIDYGGSNMVIWADGDARDYSYQALVGNPFYRKEPLYYRAAIGQKQWMSCFGFFLNMWKEQVSQLVRLLLNQGYRVQWVAWPRSRNEQSSHSRYR